MCGSTDGCIDITSVMVGGVDRTRVTVSLASAEEGIGAQRGWINCFRPDDQWMTEVSVGVSVGVPDGSESARAEVEHSLRTLN